MSLVTYEEVRPWAKAMKMRTGLRSQRGAMPPFFLEKNIGIQKFKHDSLSVKRRSAGLEVGRRRRTTRQPGDMPHLQFDTTDKWTIGEPISF